MLAKLRAFFILALLVFVLSPASVFAQGFTLPDGSQIQGHARIGQAVAVTGTNCTITAGSSDVAGSCTTTSTTATVTFGRTWGTAPTCLVVDTTSAGGAGTIPVYTVSATAMTFSTVVNAHILAWLCLGLPQSSELLLDSLPKIAANDNAIALYHRRKIA